MKIGTLLENFCREKPKNLSLILANQLIPFEVMQKITEGFSFLDRQRCSLVSKSWRKLFPSDLFQKKRLELCSQIFNPLNWNEEKKKLIEKKEIRSAFRDFPLDLDTYPCPLNSHKKLMETHYIFYIPEGFKNDKKKLKSFFKKAECINFLNYLIEEQGCQIKKSGWFAVLKEAKKITQEQIFKEFHRDIEKPYELCLGFELFLYIKMNPEVKYSDSFPLLFNFKTEIPFSEQTVFLLQCPSNQHDISLASLVKPSHLEDYNYLLMFELKTHLAQKEER